MAESMRFVGPSVEPARSQGDGGGVESLEFEAQAATPRPKRVAANAQRSQMAQRSHGAQHAQPLASAKVLLADEGGTVALMHDRRDQAALMPPLGSRYGGTGYRGETDSGTAAVYPGSYAAAGSGQGQPGAAAWRPGLPSAETHEAPAMRAFALSATRTDQRLDRRELMERGVRDLGEALRTLPGINLRSSGRGEGVFDIRGARNRTALVRIDGIPVSEPYYGFFDLDTMPITDIEAIRVSRNPAAPSDGIGGSGGVIDIQTRSALGPRGLRVQIQGAYPFDAQASVTARVNHRKAHGLRLSAGGRYGNRDLQVDLPDGERLQLEDESKRIHGGLRSEHRLKRGVLFADLWGQQRALLVPPDTRTGTQVQKVPYQTLLRGALGGDFRLGKLDLASYLSAQYTWQEIDRYRDARLEEVTGSEQLRSQRLSAGLDATGSVSKTVRLGATVFVQSDGADQTQVNGLESTGRLTVLQGAGKLIWTPTESWELESSAGAAAPVESVDGEALAPWPEAKISIKHLALDWLDWRLTAARKGRLPTLRELYEPGFGNPALDPEIANFGEFALTFRPVSIWSIEAAGYVRYLEEFIRFVNSNERTQRENLGSVFVKGMDLSTELRPWKVLAVGGAYSFIHADEDGLRYGALDMIPTHRVDGWVELSFRARASRDFVGAWVRPQWIDERVSGAGEVPAYVGVDVAAWVRPVEWLRVSARVDNALGREEFLRPGVEVPAPRFVLSMDGAWE